MASDSTNNATSDESAGHRARPAQADFTFLKEMFWFALISLGGWILAVLVLAPRLARERSAADMESDLRTSVARLDDCERQYDAAIEAIESDPFYREEVLRAVLKVKKTSEEFLKEPAAISDN